MVTKGRSKNPERLSQAWLQSPLHHGESPLRSAIPFLNILMYTGHQRVRANTGVDMQADSPVSWLQSC